MQPILKLLAWFGGRSAEEPRDRTAADCDTSITIGGFSILSAVIIGGGQYMFWSRLPHTADGALWIALTVTVIYVLFYRNLIRAVDVAGRFGRAVIYIVAGSICATNAGLAGHEWVLLAFRPQADAQAILDAAKGVTEYDGEVEKSLGLPLLRKDYKSVDDALATAQVERARIPEGVLTLRNQAQRCDRVAAGLQTRIPISPEAPGYSAAKSAWREQSRRCDAARAQANRLLSDHRRQMDDQIADLNERRRPLYKRLTDASAEHEATLRRDAPSIKTSATTGFARHTALWAAVNAGRIPRWAAVGLMFAALALEGMSFFLKIVLRADAVSQERQEATELARAAFELRMSVIGAYRARIPAAVASMGEELADDVRQDTRNVVVPGVRTEMAARAFEHAQASIARAQNRTGKPAPDLLDRLADLGTAARNTMRVSPVGSP